MRYPTLCEVFDWPEWKAFAKRLNIADDLRTKRIVITLDLDYVTTIVQEYLGTEQDRSE